MSSNSSRTSIQNDPRTNTETRRKLRKDYQKLYAETLDAHKDIIKRDRDGTKQLKSILQRGNQLHESIVHAREGALDAQWFTTTSKYGSESVQRIEETVVWDIDEFARKLCSKYRGDSEDDPIDWKALGAYTSQYYRRAPVLTFMNGPLALEAKIRKKAVRKAKQLQTGKSVRPDEVELEKEKHNAEESSKHVAKLHKRLYKAYRHNDKLSFWRIVLDPNSFTKTIENIFYYSFLVKDGNAGLRLDEGSAEIMAAPLAQTEAEGHERHQSILRLDYETYLKIVDQYAPLFVDGMNLSTQALATQGGANSNDDNQMDERRHRKRKRRESNSERKKRRVQHE
eukprot:CAMPEP_0117451318 /NCGR_PEP_ID=MMETSP0759-20121206/8942_1 /TAXON_ID=63605 /ORGANISM="Percolomonas cosmopolitus, Strain WS" /LENGTH=339 /DNA_ID=CAMNT_0005243907 /DNA_START=166 /DNA_END=1185 /DNA_ORIENTATION=-